MKKYGIYILIIALLAGAGGWFGYNKWQQRQEMREGEFAYAKGEEITKIVLTDTKGGKLELTKHGEKWRVNEKYDVRTDQLQSIMEAVTRMESLSPVPNKAHNNVLKELMAESTKVQVYVNEEDRPERTYLVGGPTLDSKQTYMLNMPDGQPAKRPHMVFLPGFRGYLTARFVADVEQWRSKTVFGINRGEIKEVKVDYSAQPEKSFGIKKVAPDSFLLAPLDEEFRINEPNKQQYVQQYLDFYQNISLETFDNTYSKRDSIKTTVPFCTVTLTNIKNEVREAKLYYMPINKRSKLQFDDKGNDLTYDLERYYAWIDGKDFAIVQYYVFGNILRSYKEFYFKPL